MYKFINNEHLNKMYKIVDAARGKRATREIELLHNALEVFRNATGLEIAIEDEEFTDAAGHRADAQVRLTAPGVEQRFAVEVKPHLTPTNLGIAVHQLPQSQRKGLIVTDYVNPKMAERLKALDMAFLDVAGNAYLNVPPLFLYIKGNKPVEMPHRKPPTRAFQSTGLKVLFALLCHPDLVNAPYRGIAKAADVALGTVGWVITDLKELGYVVDRGKRGRRLTKKENLVERWVTAYPEQLRPKLMMGRYKAADHHWWKQVPLHDYPEACWGGEVAAARLTHYLKPELVTVYMRGKPGSLLLANKLKKDPEGDVEILEAFWRTEYGGLHGELAPPLLIYADLLATGDTRNIETAKIIYEQELAGLIRED